uniref:Junctional protein associated with coronary artery disease n=1 Tax=Geotrypetes seraphini TaxID=260995 RepID=A0A6P8QKU7_GEOSA|nr:junctional protein associated with coronary artery disease [Geotrypetes seraphini]XP_033787343.1 junctional protein associated with coronary artery disease [Geotrypetes seraphini]XP_033787344.1 junctional protein associated with coronary artery disease [Geotrypetes seraphini]XP_033787345.1 junctional protein associated with coronary artery disease [Geotrypetes seraphini]XP_033787346.1 junctional protein associated with coronary artery disease [Geotrypetes seraphini]
MFSVEDLLLSHGYKLSENVTSSSENKYNTFQQEGEEAGSGPETLNGYETDSGKKPPAKGYFRENEASLGSRQITVGSYHRDQKDLGNFETSDGRFPSTAPMQRSCHKAEKDVASWRRRGQDFSILLNYTDKGHSEAKGSNTAKLENMVESNVAFQNIKENQKDTRQDRENLLRRNVLDKNWKQSVDYQWSSLNRKGTEIDNKLARQMSDGDGGKLLQEFYSFTLRDNSLNSQKKGKSQSLPRVLLPQRYENIPVLTNNNHSLNGDKLQSYPKNVEHFNSHKNSKVASDFHYLLKPKYGRPLKPPSYELHQQAWRTAEGSGGGQENLLKDKYISPFTKNNEPRQDFYIQDSSLEPPVYVPPPSYKSPSQKNLSADSLNEVPHYNVCFSNVQSCLEEKPNISQETLSNIFRPEDEFCTDGHFLCEKQGHHQYTGDYIHSVQYIPFDDPRIRHFKLEQNEGHHYGMKQRENASTISPTAWQDKNLKGIQNNCSFLDSPNLSSAAQCKNIVSEPAGVNSRLAISNADHEWCALSNQTDSSAMNVHTIDHETNQKETNGKLPLKKTQSDSACEIITKVKKLEPETVAQSRCNSKRKVNETIFCLVSIPVKSESDASATDKNNNNLPGDMDKASWSNDSESDLPGQNLLNTSSTDLELQSFTASMPDKNGLENLELCRQLDYKETTGLGLIQFAKHKELTYSGSWPGDQYRDQKTQTNYRERLKGSEFIHDSKLNIPNNKCINSNDLGFTLSGLKEQDLPLDNWQKNIYDINGQMYFSPPSKNAFMRTSSSLSQLPKLQQNQTYGTSYGNIREKQQSPISKVDVVKGGVSAPSDNKELFGQFLLKPVSRRPWDAISELESLNKEFQGQEESEMNGDRVENEEKQQKGCVFIGMSSMPAKHRPTQVKVNYNKQKIEGPEDPIIKTETGDSKSESWSVLYESDVLRLCGDQQNSLQEKDPSSKWVWPVDMQEKRATEPRNTTNKQTASPSHIRLSSSLNGANLDEMPSDFDWREINEGKIKTDDLLLDLTRLSKATVPHTGQSEQIDPITYLPVNKQGLPEQDLSHLEFDIGQQLNTNTISSFYGKQNAPEIPENESVQARATRILGIEVGMDFLISNNTSNEENHHPKPAFVLGLPTTERISASVQKDVRKQENSSFISEKQNLKESFLKEDVHIISKKTAHIKCQNTDKNVRDNLATEREQGLDHLRHFKKEEQGPNLLCQSVARSLDKPRAAPASEKRARGTSKKIETLQGKLASIPSRTAMDRLVRMKEVDSVSRMRRLSCKSTDSGDEAEDDKQRQMQEEKGHAFTLDGNDASYQVTHTGFISKQIISLSESIPLSPKGRKIPEEAYDPTRVERV